MAENLVQLRLKQLRITNRRALLLVLAPDGLLFVVGSIRRSELHVSLGAVFVISHRDVAREAAMIVAFACGVVGVCGLLFGSALLVWETRQTLAVLAQETRLVVESYRKEAARTHPDPSKSSEATT